jgi:hypothetical protein
MIFLKIKFKFVNLFCKKIILARRIGFFDLIYFGML